MFVIVTLAPGITAPEESLTVPTTLPVPTVVWENSGREMVNRAITRSVSIGGPLLAAALMMAQLTAAGPCSGVGL